MLVQAAWSAVRVRGRLQARYNRLVRRFGGDKNPGARKKAILAIAHTLLKIAYQACDATDERAVGTLIDVAWPVTAGSTC